MTGYEQRFYETFPTLIKNVGEVAKANEQILSELKALNTNFENLINILNKK